MRTSIHLLLIAAVSLFSVGQAPLSIGQAPQLNPTVNVTVDASANRHSIDPRIYGVAWAGTAAIADLGATLNRWGGNAVSRHNWENSTTNRAKDWFFENIPDELTGPGDGSNGQSADEFIARTFAGGAQPVMTIPLMGLLPKARTIECGYSVIKYGPQQAVDPYRPDCGNGKGLDDKRLLDVNDPADTSAVYPASHQGDWVNHLVGEWGSADAGGVRYYSLDNEPSLWSFDHWDVHPAGSTYDEVWGKMAEYGALIKEKDPGALLTGIEEWGWSGYFSSGSDLETGDDADRNAHGGVYYSEWLLQQAQTYEATEGQRILDIAALHFYPQGDAFGHSEFSDDTDVPTQQLRNRSTRSLWDPAYVNESWIGGTGIDGGVVKLIPRLRDWVSTNYPGTLTAITEYNWGAEEHINGATAQADILGIFGREGLDVGIRWTTPQAGSLAYNAFKMYRNYDGAGGRFGDLSISATGSNADEIAVFAALRSSDRALTVMVVAKNLSDSTPVNVNLANFTPTGNAARWELNAGNVITPLAAVLPVGSTIPVIVPPQSITLLVLPGTWVDAPASVTATATSTSSVSLTWPPVAGASSYEVYRSSMNGPFVSIGTAPATNFTDGGASANTAYLYRIRAISAGIYSGFSPADVATTVLFTDDPLVPGTVAKSAHLTQLRTAVNALRAAAGLPAATLTDTPLLAGTVIKAVHFAQLRHAANQARARAGLSYRTYNDTALVAGSTPIRAAHVTDVRSAVK